VFVLRQFQTVYNIRGKERSRLCVPKNPGALLWTAAAVYGKMQRVLAIAGH
jgi:hypothetical protein